MHIGVVSMIDKKNPRLARETFTLPLQELGTTSTLYWLDLTYGSKTLELARQATVDVALLIQRSGHQHSLSLDAVGWYDSNGTGFKGTMPDRDMYTEGSSHQAGHSKTADHKVNHKFQMVFVDLMAPIASSAPGGCVYLSKTSDEHTKWTEVFSLNSNNGDFSFYQCFVVSVMVLDGFGPSVRGPTKVASTSATSTGAPVLRRKR